MPQGMATTNFGYAWQRLGKLFRGVPYHGNNPQYHDIAYYFLKRLIGLCGESYMVDNQAL